MPMIPIFGTYEWALMQMKAGKAVRRRSGTVSDRLWIAQHGLMYHTEDGALYKHAVTSSEVLATDWRLAKEGEDGQ